MALAAGSTPAHAAVCAAIETLVVSAHLSQPGSMIEVDLRILNDGEEGCSSILPGNVPGTMEISGHAIPVTLERAAETTEEVEIQPQGFARARYWLAAPSGLQQASGAALTVPQWQPKSTAVAIGEPSRSGNVVADGEHAIDTPIVPPPSDRTAGNAFLSNLSVYEPIYAAYGPGTDTDARIQLSFKYKLFGSRELEARPRSLLDGLYFAYTQRMFWDLSAHSSPFRNIDFQPELFYLSPPLALSSKATISGQAGVRHESNGRDGAASRSVNMIYAAPMASISLGDDRRLTIAPRLWFYFGDLSDNPDIRRYRGNSGVFVEVGEDDGLRLSTSTRFNFGSGKGAVSADVSYPLRRILRGGPDFYLFGQSFVGYGENILDYNRRETRFRLGVALVR